MIMNLILSLKDRIYRLGYKASKSILLLYKETYLKQSDKEKLKVQKLLTFP